MIQSLRSKIFIFLLAISVTAISEVRLPKLIRDGTVLQSAVELKVWDWAAPGEPVTVHFRDSTFRVTNDSDDEGYIILPLSDDGGPYKTLIRAGKIPVVNNRITVALEASSIATFASD